MIKLTVARSVYEDFPLYVNSNFIATMQRSTRKAENLTLLTMSNDSSDSWVSVRETPEEILDMIKKGDIEYQDDSHYIDFDDWSLSQP